MKAIGLVILAAGIAFLPPRLNAQTATGVPDSIIQVTAQAQGLAWVPAYQAPFFGTFWLFTPGFSGPVPLPCPPDDPTFPIYAIADGQFLVDGTGGQTPAAQLAAQAQAVVNLISQIQTVAANQQARALGMDDGLIPPGAGSGGDDGDYTPSGGPAVPIDTNRLWLEMITVTNQTASLVIHPPPADTHEVYELLYTTNLLVPPANWQWVLRSFPDVTNLVVPNATDAQGFYRLSSPNDFVANDSLGTNFWLAFCGLYNDGDSELSLFISSPMGATGMITTPGLTANGPILVVTNCGDTTLDGKYVLTNLTQQEQTDFSVSASTGYVNGTNWVVFNGSKWTIWIYDPSASIEQSLYDKPGIDLNESATDWQYDGDPSVPYPTTICTQVRLVSQSFTVAAGAMTNISIPLSAMLDVYDMVETNGINILADHPVSVYGFDYDQLATTAFTGYPTTFLGTNYCVMSRASMLPFAEYGDNNYSQLAIVATETNTMVTIIPSPTAHLEGHTNAYTTNLLQGETYQIHSRNDTEDAYTNDVTGTLIVSDKPIAVFAGANAARVPNEATNWANPLVQEQIPVDSWGQQVLALSFAGRTGGDSYRVLAAIANTIIFTNGVEAGTNQAGQFLDLTLDGPIEFKGSKPIQVAQFANGTDYDNQPGNEGDPCEILLPPIGHCLETNIVATGPSYDQSIYPPTGFDENYLNIIVIQSAITNTFVDGFPMVATNFQAIANSGYFGAQIPVATGSHTVRSSQPVEVEVYGFGFEDAYGYFGGMVK